MEITEDLYDRPIDDFIYWDDSFSENDDYGFLAFVDLRINDFTFITRMSYDFIVRTVHEKDRIFEDNAIELLGNHILTKYHRLVSEPHKNGKGYPEFSHEYGEIPLKNHRFYFLGNENSIKELSKLKLLQYRIKKLTSK